MSKTVWFSKEAAEVGFSLVSVGFTGWCRVETGLSTLLTTTGLVVLKTRHITVLSPLQYSTLQCAQLFLYSFCSFSATLPPSGRQWSRKLNKHRSCEVCLIQSQCYWSKALQAVGTYQSCHFMMHVCFTEINANEYLKFEWGHISVCSIPSVCVENTCSGFSKTMHHWVDSTRKFMFRVHELVKGREENLLSESGSQIKDYNNKIKAEANQSWCKMRCIWQYVFCMLNSGASLLAAVLHPNLTTANALHSVHFSLVKAQTT